MNITGDFSISYYNNNQKLVWAGYSFTAEGITSSTSAPSVSIGSNTFNRERITFDASGRWTGEKKND